MAETVTIANLSIRYEDVFSMKELYKAIREWLIAEGYADGGRDEQMEKFYLEKLGTSGKEIWVWWRTSKKPHGSPYFLQWLNIDFHVLNMKDVEIVHKGTKVKANSGEVEVMINANLQTGVDADIEKTFLRAISDIFKRKIYRKEIDEHRKVFEQDIASLQNTIKQFLELREFLPASEMLHPRRGLA